MESFVKPFKHSSKARSEFDMLKIRIKYGMEGYGLYWALYEHLHQHIYISYDDNGIQDISKALNMHPDYMRQYLDYCNELYLFPQFKGKVYSVYVLGDLTKLPKRLKRDPKSIPILEYIKNLPPRKETRMFHINPMQWNKLRLYIFKRDNYTCAYCGKRGGKLECDHIIPFSKGGTNDPENLTTSCKRCNVQKSDMPVEEFMKWRKEKQL